MSNPNESGTLAERIEFEWRSELNQYLTYGQCDGDATSRILALVAEALLSDDAVEAAAKSRGGFTDYGWTTEEATSDFRDELMRSSERDIKAAIAAAVITTTGEEAGE